MRRNSVEEALHFFFREILHLVLGDLGSAYLLRVADLKPTHLLQVTEKTPEPGEHGGYRSGCQGCIQKTTLKEGQVLTRNVGYWTVANRGNEFWRWLSYHRRAVGVRCSSTRW